MSVKQKTLANGKTWAQIEADAKKAKDSGITYWPEIALQLLKRNYELELEMQTLRQGELFAPPPLTAQTGGEA